MKSFAYFIAAAVAAGICFGTGALWAKRKPDLTATAAQPRPKERGVLRFAPSAPQLAMLAIAPVPTMPVPLAEPLNARVAFDESHTARVSSPISGRIVELRAQLGDRVPAGGLLALIDAPDLGAAAADLAKAQADERRKEAALRRVRELYDAEVAPKKDLETAETELAQAKAETARAALRLANLNPRRAKIIGQTLHLTTPVGGVVAERKANPGMEVRPDLPDALFIVTDVAHLQLVVDLPEQHLGKISVGQPVAAEADAWPEDRFHGRIERIAPVVDPATRRVQVRCSVENLDARLRPEMYARVSVLADEARSAVRVPNSALVTEGLYSFVFVEREPGVFDKRKIELMVQDREFSYVGAGLMSGERVVVRGALLLNSELASGT